MMNNRNDIIEALKEISLKTFDREYFTRELLKKVDNKSYLEDTIIEIANDKEQPASVRLEAAIIMSSLLYNTDALIELSINDEEY